MQSARNEFSHPYLSMNYKQNTQILAVSSLWQNAYIQQFDFLVIHVIQVKSIFIELAVSTSLIELLKHKNYLTQGLDIRKNES
jgi:hypothetical protein